jgi:serine/threonine protein phosphatase PrpC
MTQHFLEVVSVTDAGRVRQYNEDSVAVDRDRRIMALADGMGGHRAGEIASKMATEIILSSLQADVGKLGSRARDLSPMRAVDQSINRANRAVFDAAKGRSAYHGMGTTLVVALFYDNRVALGHIGDSRAYRLRGDVLELLTRDDSLLRDQVELGIISAADASASHNRSLVTRALGIAEDTIAHVREDDASPDDVFLLCSDGLNDAVDDTDIELIVKALKTNMPLAAQHLIQAANDNGGYDNVSVILAKVLRPFPAPRHLRWLHRLFGWTR